MSFEMRSTSPHFSSDTEDNPRSSSGGYSSASPPSGADSASLPSPPLQASTPSTTFSNDDDVAQGQHSKLDDVGADLDTGSDKQDMVPQTNLTHSCKRMFTPEEAQQQLEVMSQSVMDIWATLRSLEVSLSDAQSPTPLPNLSADATISVLSDEGFAGAQSTCKQCENQQSETQTVQSTGSDARAHSFKPSVVSYAGVGAVLRTAMDLLRSTPGVETTELTLGVAGTIAMVRIHMSPNSQQPLISSVVANAKAAILHAAACSQNVYVLGYEAVPFEDIDSGTGFSGTLATAPATRQHSVCWEIYTQGVCPRGRTCKWKHPGRNGIQVVRVVCI